jgi:hypothetical protein
LFRVSRSDRVELQIRDVSKTPPNGVQAPKDVSLPIPGVFTTCSTPASPRCCASTATGTGQMTYVYVIAGWAAVVAFLFPPLFGFD